MSNQDLVLYRMKAIEGAPVATQLKKEKIADMSHDWGGQMNCVDNSFHQAAVAPMFANTNTPQFAATTTNTTPFVTTKRRNPFGGACQRPKAAKRSKLDGEPSLQNLKIAPVA